MTKRLLLALGIWLVIMVVWTKFFPPEVSKTQRKTKVSTKKVEKQKVKLKKVIRRNEEITKKNKANAVQTKILQFGLNNIDGTVDSIKLLKYKESGKSIDFIEKNIKYYGNFKVSLYSLNDAYKQNEAIYNYKKLNNYEHQFSKRLKNGIVINKIYRFYKDKYFFDLNIKLENKSGKTWKNENGDFSYSLVWGSPIDWRTDKKTTSFYDKNEVIYCSDDESLEEVDEDDKSINSFKWMGIQDRYFLLAFVPIERNGNLRAVKKITSANIYISKDGKKKRFALNRESENIPKDGSITDNFRIFIGPKKHSLLTSGNLKEYQLDKILKVSFPLIGSIIKLLAIGIEKLMYFVYDLINNYGIVIILVTLLIKLLLYPLTHKSFTSMKKMQLIQPKLNALKEQYKDDKASLNKKMMELYKKEGVNPMGGCLPMLLQLPIFIALYNVLPRMVDLKNVSFLWINDLSSPDTIAKISAFKELPILPENINILPVIMTIVSILQTKLSGTGGAGAVTDQQKQQGKMMLLMPVLFLFLFWNMPSGLVLYWTVMNIFSIIQQVYINKKYDKEKVEVVK